MNMISLEDFLFYLDDALDAMIGIVAELGDELANRRPDLPGANSPYAILTHCLGVIEFWGGHAVAGRSIVRDRPAEFLATGPVDELVESARVARGKLGRDLDGFEPYSKPRGELNAKDSASPLGRTQGGVVMHIYEELAQHRGQMEVTRDLILAESSSG
jgi:Protein of unknown function (DUF664)